MKVKKKQIIKKMSVFAQIREFSGLSQARLAQVLGTTIGTISRWENGRSEPSLTFKQIKHLHILMSGMGLSLEDLPDDPFNEIDIKKTKKS